MTRPSASSELHEQGKRALAEGNAGLAQTHLWKALCELTKRERGPLSPDSDLRHLSLLRDLRASYLALGNAKAALSIDWYLQDAPAAEALLAEVPAFEHATTLQSWAEQAWRGDGEKNSRQALTLLSQAATLFQQAKQPAHAAICQEKAHDYAAARESWRHLIATLQHDPQSRYAAGLAHFNLARMCTLLKADRQAHSAIVASVHALEEAADRYEERGQRERSFDCYQVLIAIGAQGEQFEHVLEGYINVIRILKEDNLRHYALQSYEDALLAAEGQGEFAAGASIALELSQYARQEGMLQLSAYGTTRQAELWQRVAAATAERGHPPEIAENALLAAIVSLARLGQFDEVGRLYQAASELDLEEARCAHYKRASMRYRKAGNQPLEAHPLPRHLRQSTDFPEVWHVDLVEWEQAGSAANACADILLNGAHSGERLRRRALLARLRALSLEQAAPTPLRSDVLELAEQLGSIELYAVVSPLERLFKSPDPEIRKAAIMALRRCMYKRSLITVRAALDDPEPAVRQQACQALEALAFPHALDVLARIYRESKSLEARLAALRALARIDSPEAAQLLVGVYQYGGENEWQAMTEALKRARGTAFRDALQPAFKALSRGARQQASSVLSARGQPLP